MITKTAEALICVGDVVLGKHTGVPDSEFDAAELAMGAKVEKEHTDLPEIAKQIAKDHLIELPDYYTRLKAMEAEGKKFWDERRKNADKAS